MQESRADQYMIANAKYFPASKMAIIKDKLLAAPEERYNYLAAVELKDPTTLLLISLFLGYLGVDRFMIKDTSMGILKLLTFGGCGILTVIDWFMISDKTKEYNFNNLMMVL